METQNRVINLEIFSKLCNGFVIVIFSVNLLGKIVIGSLVLLTGAALVILYLLYVLYGGSAGVSDSGSRLHLSHYSGSSNEFRFGPSRISGIQTNIEKFLKRK